MSVNEIMLELAEELVNPAEIALSDTIEEQIEEEDDIVAGIAEEDDDVIAFIDNGERITNEETVDFTQYDGEYIIEDDDDEDDDDESI